MFPARSQFMKNEFSRLNGNNNNNQSYYIIL